VPADHARACRSTCRSLARRPRRAARARLKPTQFARRPPLAEGA
jgi:hypothetical protein